MLRRALIAAVIPMMFAVLSAPPAGAQPGQPGPPPCDLALSFLCRMVPMAPELDHDVDLTQQLPPADPNTPLPEALPPADPCAAGCI